MKISAITPNQYKSASRSNNTQNNAPQTTNPSFKKIVYVTSVEELKKLTKDANVIYKEIGKLAQSYDKKFKDMFEIRVKYEKIPEILRAQLEFRVQPSKKREFLKTIEESKFDWGFGIRKSLREAARRQPLKDYDNKYTEEYVERVTHIRYYDEKMYGAKFVPLFEHEYNVPDKINEKYKEMKTFRDIIGDLELSSPVRGKSGRPRTWLDKYYWDYVLDKDL